LPPQCNFRLIRHNILLIPNIHKYYFFKLFLIVPLIIVPLIIDTL
jgi:hypothetical protein